MKIAVILSAYDKMSTVVNAAVDKAQSKLKGLQKFRKGLDSFGNKAAIGGGIASAVLASTLKAAEESKIAENKLKQVFRNRGETNDKAATSALKYANSLQSVIAVEDEEIAAIQAKIAINKSVTDKANVFNRATLTAFNIAATGYGDASSNAAKLGKMLEHPVQGINAFAKAGILFTAEEKAKVKALVDSGNQLKAQDFLLSKLEGKFANVAANSAPASEKLKIAFGEIGENVGSILLPKVEQFAGYLTNDLIPKFQNFIEKNPVLVKVLGAVAAALTVVGVAAKVLSAIMMVNPIVLVIAAIAAGAYLIISNWGAIKKWFSDMWAKVTSVFSGAWKWIKGMFLNYTPYGLIIKHWDKIKDFFSGLWEGVKSIFSKLWEGIKKVIWDYQPAVLIYNNWDAIKQWFTDLWDSVTGIFTRAWDKLKNIVSNAWNGIKGFFGFGDNALDKTLQKMEKVNTAAQNYQNTVKSTSTAAAKSGAVTALNNYAVGLAAPASALQPNPVNNTSNSSTHYAPVFNLVGASKQDMQALAETSRNDFDKRMKEHEARKSRVKF